MVEYLHVMNIMLKKERNFDMLDYENIGDL